MALSSMRLIPAAIRLAFSVGAIGGGGDNVDVFFNINLLPSANQPAASPLVAPQSSLRSNDPILQFFTLETSEMHGARLIGWWFRWFFLGWLS